MEESTSKTECCNFIAGIWAEAINTDTQMTLKSDTTVSQKRSKKPGALIINPIH